MQSRSCVSVVLLLKTENVKVFTSTLIPGLGFSVCLLMPSEAANFPASEGRSREGGNGIKKKGGGGGGIWIGQWSECKKESGGRSRIKGERVDKNLSSLRSLLYNPECSLAGFLPAIKTFNFFQSSYCCYSSQHYLSALLLFSPAIEMSWSGCMCLWGGGWILLIEILCMVSMGMVNFAERERKTARVNKRKQKKGESGTEFVRTLPPSWRQSEEWETFSASFLPLIYCISFYFFTRRPLSPCFPRRSLPLSPFHSFFLLSFVTCHPAQVSALHPLHLFSPLTPMLKRDNGTPCCVMMCTRARVLRCPSSSILCFVLTGRWCHAHVWQNNQQT